MLCSAAAIVAAVPCGLEQVPAPPKPQVKGKGLLKKLATGAHTPPVNQPHAKPPCSLLYCRTQSSHVALLEHDAEVKPDAGQEPK